MATVPSMSVTVTRRALSICMMESGATVEADIPAMAVMAAASDMISRFIVVWDCSLLRVAYVR